MGRVVVTGALGNVGSAVVAALADRDVDDVRVADVDPDELTDRHRDLESTRLDFTDPATFEAVLDGAGQVFLIRPPAISRVGTTIAPFIDAANAGGVDHIVFSSVAGAESNRIVPHHRIERHLIRSGLDWTILRPGFFAQNLATAYRQDIVEDDRIHVPAGDGLVAFIDARDIGEVAAVCLTEDGHRQRGYHLTGPEAVTFTKVASLLSDRLARTIRYEPASVVGYFRHLRGQGLLLPQALVQTILHTGLRRGAAEPVTTTVPGILGRPARTLEQYIDDFHHLWHAPGPGSSPPSSTGPRGPDRP